MKHWSCQQQQQFVYMPQVPQRQLNGVSNLRKLHKVQIIFSFIESMGTQVQKEGKSVMKTAPTFQIRLLKFPVANRLKHCVLTGNDLQVILTYLLSCLVCRSSLVVFHPNSKKCLLIIHLMRKGPALYTKKSLGSWQKELLLKHRMMFRINLPYCFFHLQKDSRCK